MRKQFLLGSASAATLALAAGLFSAVPAGAIPIVCTITGTGSVSAPNAGDAIVCDTSGPSTTTTGASNVSYTVNDNIAVTNNGLFTGVVNVGDNAILNLKSGASLLNSSGKGKGFVTTTGLTATIASGASITSIEANSVSGGNNKVTLAGTVNLDPSGRSILLYGTGNRLTLQPGYSIAGLVYGSDSPSNATTSVLELGGSGSASFDVSGIETTKYFNFRVFEKNGASTWTLTGTATAQNTPWTIKGGILAISDNNALGSPTSSVTLNGGTLQAAGTLALGHSITLDSSGGGLAAAAGLFSISNPVTGTGPLTISGPGQVFLSNIGNNYSGDTIIASGGKVSFDGGRGASVNSSFTVAAGGQATFGAGDYALKSLNGAGTVIIDQSDAVGARTLTLQNGTFTGTLTENSAKPGQKIVAGSGTTILAGTNSWTGGTTINSGATLVFGNGGTGGNLPITGALVNNGTLGFNHSDNVTFNNAFSGTGQVTQLGSGTITFTGTNSFTGNTNINAGTVSFNGTNSGGAIINSGGTLKGSGTLGGFTANSGGTIAPGNSIGTLNVAGNVSFASGSVYQVEVNNAGASDKIVATGTATISGGTVQVLSAAGTYAATNSYTIINATGGVTGTFGAVTSDLAFFTPSLAYSSNAVTLTLTQNAPVVVAPATPSSPAVTLLFPSVAKTFNQISSSSAINLGVKNGLYNAVLVSSTANALAAFDGASGEIHATLLASQLQSATIQRRSVLERMRTSTGEGWQVWGDVTGNSGSLDADGNAAQAKTKTVAMSFGVDGDIATGWRAGLEGGYGNAKLKVAARGSSADTSSGHVGGYIYGGYEGFTLRGGLSYGFGTADTLRSIAFASFIETVSASQDVDTLQAFVEAGYPIVLDSVTLEPFVGFSGARAHAGSFAEVGGFSALSGVSQSVSQSYLNFGAQLQSGGGTVAGMTVAPLLRATWQHGFDNDPIFRNQRFVSGGPAFSVLGNTLDQDRALIDAGLTITPAANVGIFLGYTGSFGSRGQDNGMRLQGRIGL